VQRFLLLALHTKIVKLKEVAMKTTFILLTVITTLITPSAFAVNRVLSLDGDGDYVELPQNIFNELDEATVEGWIKWEKLGKFSRFFDFGALKRNMLVYCFVYTNHLGFALYDENGSQHRIAVEGILSEGTWCHIAAVSGKSGMKLYFNGVLVGENPYDGSFSRISGENNLLGQDNSSENRPTLNGQLDEVRVWSVARTEKQIRDTMFTSLHGDEPSLVGYWRFEDKNNIATDSSPNRSDGKLVGDAHCVEAELPEPGELLLPIVISGRITTEDGKPIRYANVRLEQNGEKITQAQSDAEGNYRLVILEKVRGLFDLFATKDELGDLRLGLRLRLGLSAKRIETKGESRTLNLTLKEAISISGKLMMLDDMTPHVAVVVQAVSDGKRIATVLSDEEGKYRFINLKPGQYQVRCYTTNGYVYYQNGEILRVQRGSRLSDINFRMPPFKKGVWRHYTSLDGLPYSAVGCILPEPDGTLLFGTDGGGVCRYDGQEFVALTDKDGLPFPAAVWGMVREPDGPLWLAAYGDGAVRYDGEQFVSFTTEDGLVANTISSLYRQPSGEMWFGEDGGAGVSRYDGSEWVSFPTKEGFPAVMPIQHDSQGRMWFIASGGLCYYDGNQFVRFGLEDGLAKHYEVLAHSAIGNGRLGFTSDGVMWLSTARYDGQTFSTLTPEDGWPEGQIMAMECDSDGALWLGMWRGAGGVSQYDGTGFINFTTHDGLLTKAVKDLHWDADGALWVATGSAVSWSTRGGVSRYDDKTFINFTTKDGLSSNRISALHSDPDGSLWIGTADGGVSHYNGKGFAHFTTEDGLAYNRVSAIHRDPSGALWFGTGGLWAGANGVSRYDGSVPEWMKSASDAPNVEASVNGRRQAFVNLLPGKTVRCIESEPDGTMWFGGSGVFRYDGETFTSFTTEDGLPNNKVLTVCRDPEGMMWFGTMDGLSRYDGQTFVNVNFTPREGYFGNAVKALYWDTDGAMWLATWGSGIFRYDGKAFTNFTTKDGLASNSTTTIYQASDGILWIGTDGKGVCGYDGKVFTSLDQRDGLAGNAVTAIVEDSDGALWFGTHDGGLTHYQRSKTRPKVRIVSLTTDKTYRDLTAIPSLTIGSRAIFEYNAIDFKTLPEKRQYRLRIINEDNEAIVDWQLTKADTFSYLFQTADTYTFEVVSIDRDLNYSEPAYVTLKVVPPFYMRAGFLIPSVGGGTILLATLVILATALIKRRREVRAYEREAVRELQDAKQVQMGLMPDTAPPIEGVEIAGKCLSANTVSGDFFDYVEGKRPNEIALVVGDVCGKAMKGAMNAVMTDGILRAVAMEQGEFTPASLMMTLNNTLKGRLEQYMNVTMVIGMINADTKTLTLANAGHHAHPLLVSNGDVQVLKIGGLPLGMRAGIEYSEEKFALESGDVVIFMTDGIIEAMDSEEQLYSDSGRLEETISQFTLEQSAEAMVEAIIADAIDFGRDKESRDDDMTVVVAKVL